MSSTLSKLSRAELGIKYQTEPSSSQPSRKLVEHSQAKLAQQKKLSFQAKPSGAQVKLQDLLYAQSLEAPAHLSGMGETRGSLSQTRIEKIRYQTIQHLVLLKGNFVFTELAKKFMKHLEPILS